MDGNKEESVREDGNCRPLTDEEFKAFQEEEKRTEKKINWVLSAVQGIVDFFTW